MKLSKKQLKKIITEEIQAVLKEANETPEIKKANELAVQIKTSLSAFEIYFTNNASKIIPDSKSQQDINTRTKQLKKDLDALLQLYVIYIR